MASKRNRWHKKQLRRISKSYRVTQTKYVTKRIREERQRIAIGYAKAFYEESLKPRDEFEQFRNYAKGEQTGNPFK